MQESEACKVIEGADINPIDGVIELMDSIENNKLVMGLASSSSIEVIEYILNKFRCRRHFRTIVSGYDVERGNQNLIFFWRQQEF